MRKQPTLDTLRREHAEQLEAERKATGWISAAERAYREHEDAVATAADRAAWSAQDR